MQPFISRIFNPPLAGAGPPVYDIEQFKNVVKYILGHEFDTFWKFKCDQSENKSYGAMWRYHMLISVEKYQMFRNW